MRNRNPCLAIAAALSLSHLHEHLVVRGPSGERSSLCDP